ncbi:MAG: hypothetical protein WA791_09385, partial [Rhodomicrobium sp.]
MNGRDAEDISAALSSALTAADAGIADAANDIAESPSLPKGDYGQDAPRRDAMISAVEGFIQDLMELYPAVLARNSIYSFTNSETSFANSLGVHQSQR